MKLNRILLILRLLIAAIFLWHGIPKAIDVAGAIEKFEGFGLPGFLGPITGWAEVVASVLLLAGYATRLAASILTVIIAGAILAVQLPNGIQAGLERDLLILVGCVLILAEGPGASALDRRNVSLAGA